MEIVPRMGLVIDANILVRAMLGHKVTPLIKRYGLAVDLHIAGEALLEARFHTAGIAAKRRWDAAELSRRLDSLVDDLKIVERSQYESQLDRAAGRLRARDIDDAPTLAVSLLLDCPIWTEDQDFFGCGVATWTSDRVDIYFSGDPNR